MIINIFGSTGEIGRKTLRLISKYYPEIKINLLCADKNTKTIINQIKNYKPKYVYLDSIQSSNELKLKNYKKTKILNFKELSSYLKKSKSDLTILAVSGYKSLYYLDDIIYNTKNLGLVNKEAIVSAGHIFKNNKYFNKTNIFPLDSEHFSMFSYNNSLKISNYEKIILTASGGPFHKHNFNSLKNVTFNQAIKHPKWQMGYKNSIDSATLVNKCLEIIEAHYLFDIPFNKIDILIHPQAIVHSIIIKENHTTIYNAFNNDMSIPLLNFLNLSNLKSNKMDSNLAFSHETYLEFNKIKDKVFPIYKFFIKLDKSNPANIIKFNIGNEIAVNMFKLELIKYTEILKIIKKVVSIKLYSPLNNIRDIIKFHENVNNKCKLLFKDFN
tara:strand:+ start:111 stop:1262 length:1152 start_codon:yes stop_codon:yes gene_type:complete